MNEEEKKALRVINARTRRLLDELEIEKEDMSDEPRIAYLMQEIRANKTILNLIEKLQKENDKLNIKLDDKEAEIQILKDDIKADDIEYKHVIEILKKENEEYSKQLDLDYVDKNYISKKKIEDELEELKGKLEDISKRREKSKTKEEKTVLWCLEIRTDERIKTLHELLENYKMNPKQ
jgi:hypothetical protein